MYYCKECKIVVYDNKAGYCPNCHCYGTMIYIETESAILARRLPFLRRLIKNLGLKP